MAATVATDRPWKLEIVKRTDAHRFVALPKRWIVERTFAWISRNRRLAKRLRALSPEPVAFVRLAMIRIMLRRLTPNPLSMNREFLGACMSAIRDTAWA